MRICQHLAFVLFLGWSGCVTAPPQPLEDSLVQSPELRKLNPVSFAVLQIEDRSGGDQLQPLLESMRAQVADSLIDRYYSPLKAMYVDARMRRAIQNASMGDRSIIERDYLVSLAGSAEEDAILAVQISHWDQTSLLVNNKVRFAAKVTLLSSVKKTVLWSGELRGEVQAGGRKAAPRDPAARARSAAKEAMRALIGKLPRRQA